MNEHDRMDDPVDGLVRSYLDSEQATVDTDALMDGIRRRRARRRVVRLSFRLCAAAATLLVVVGVLSHPGGPLKPPASSQPPSIAALPADLLAAVRQELEAALRGAASSGAAAVSAGKAPLVEVAQAGRLLPDAVDRTDGAVDRFLESTSPRSDHN